jgi:hypothetical protein
MWYPLSLHLSRHPLVRPPPRLLRAQSPWSPRALSDVFHRTCSTTFCVIRPTLESTLRSTCYRANDSTSPLPPIRPDYFIFSGRHTVCACVLHVQCPGTATTNLTTRYVSIDSHPRTTLLKVHIPYSCGISPISRDTTRLVWHFLGLNTKCIRAQKTPIHWCPFYVIENQSQNARQNYQSAPGRATCTEYYTATNYTCSKAVCRTTSMCIGKNMTTPDPASKRAAHE